MDSSRWKEVHNKSNNSSNTFFYENQNTLEHFAFIFLPLIAMLTGSIKVFEKWNYDHSPDRYAYI